MKPKEIDWYETTKLIEQSAEMCKGCPDYKPNGSILGECLASSCWKYPTSDTQEVQQ